MFLLKPFSTFSEIDDFDSNQEVYFRSDDFLAKIGRNRNDLISVSYIPLPGATYNNTLMCYTINPLSQEDVGQNQEIVRSFESMNETY